MSETMNCDTLLRMQGEEVGSYLGMLESLAPYPERLELRVSDEEWSVGQTLRHLVLTHQVVWRQMTAHAPKAGPYQGDALFKPGFLNGMIIRSMSVPGKRVGTMKALEPGEIEPTQAWSEWQEMVAQYRAALNAIEGRDLLARFRHPRVGLATMSHAEGLEMFRVHLAYHKFQLEVALG